MYENWKFCPHCGKSAKIHGGASKKLGHVWWSVICGGCGVHFRDIKLWGREDIDALTTRPDDLRDQQPHEDDKAVDRFAAAMKAKLAKKRADGLGGWEDKEECSQGFLSRLLREHVEKGDPIDVANLAMMLQQRGETVSSLLEVLGGDE